MEHLTKTSIENLTLLAYEKIENKVGWATILRIRDILCQELKPKPKPKSL